jgi:hypothetical protein
MSEQEKARALGLKRYRDGRVCRNGHSGERYTKDKSCCECQKARVKAHHKRDHNGVRVPAEPVKVPLAEIKRISSFISPPTRAQLMGGR